jgi:hypothetical protein
VEYLYGETDVFSVEPIFHGAEGAKKGEQKLEARNPKIETNPNDIIPNLQNYRIE